MSTILGDSTKNKWCAFCKYWYDPANSALTPRKVKNMYDVNKDVKNRCTKGSLSTQALYTCKYFTPKF